MSWKVRTRIVAELCSALLFLHSSKPDSIIHGDLTPGKIYLDSELCCKIGDIAVCRLVPEATLRCPSFRQNTEQAEAFPYTDPEYQRTGKPTLKSDIYSMGIIILQLVTGRPPAGLASEVRRALLGGKLSSILDRTAGEWPLPVAVRLAEFGLCCSEMNARDRPELTPEVVRELKQLLVPEERQVPPFFLCPIRQVSGGNWRILSHPLFLLPYHLTSSDLITLLLRGGWVCWCQWSIDVVFVPSYIAQ